MGKKDKAGMAQQQARFVAGAVKNGVEKADAGYIFELVDKFAGYGFNKSHAAAYALVSYHTAYMKANYREEFLAASMTLDMGNTDKLAQFAAEAKKSGIVVQAAMRQCLRGRFPRRAVAQLGKPGAIRYSLAALKNIGAAAVATIVAERTAKGRYQGLADFASRAATPRRSTSARWRRLLQPAPSTRSRRTARWCTPTSKASWHWRSARDGQRGLWHRRSLRRRRARRRSSTCVQRKRGRRWSGFQYEFDAVGFYLSGHPLDQLRARAAEARRQELRRVRGADRARRGAGQLAGIVISARERRSQKGNKFAFAMFSDATGQFEAVIFSDTLAQCRDLLEPGTPVLLAVAAERDGDTVKMRVEGMRGLDKAVAGVQRGLKLVLDRRLHRGGRRPSRRSKARLKPGGKGEIRLVLAARRPRPRARVRRSRAATTSRPRAPASCRRCPGLAEVLEI